MPPRKQLATGLRWDAVDHAQSEFSWRLGHASLQLHRPLCRRSVFDLLLSSWAYALRDGGAESGIFHPVRCILLKAPD